MRAAAYERTGPAAEVLAIVDLPTPVPGPGEVRVRIATSGVNPSDVKTRAGVRTKTLAFPQIVPHSDGAGTIDAVGSGVDTARVGQRVWIWNGAWGRPFGTAAEFIVTPAAQAVPLPDSTDFASGACLGIPALTAWQAVAIDGGSEGKTVLVAGGAGAVGHYAIQFAKLAGAKRIIATVSSAEKAALAQSAGADLVINYKDGDLVQRCLDATGGVGIDRIIEVDLAANIASDLAMLRPESDIIVYGSGAAAIEVPFMPALIKQARLRFFIVYNLNAGDRARAIRAITDQLAANRLMHNVAVRLPLSRIAEAHQIVEGGKAMGNVVVDLSGDASS